MQEVKMIALVFIITSKPYLHQNGLRCVIMDILYSFLNIVVQHKVKQLAMILINDVNCKTSLQDSF
jgi:hypothetical protein